MFYLIERSVCSGINFGNVFGLDCTISTIEQMTDQKNRSVMIQKRFMMNSSLSRSQKSPGLSQKDLAMDSMVGCISDHTFS